MDNTNPVELILFLKVLEILQEKVHIRRMGKKTSLDNEKKVIWRLNIDISVYRESIH
ncbi:MAG TPA: hypothetical protein HA261_00015 [Methanosarcina sp.]|nr:hypothetical protein [Methanosarcina sp.]